MAKISALPLVDALAGDEALPLVQAGDTRRLSLQALVTYMAPRLPGWIKGDKGDTGASNNTRAGLAQLKAAAVADLTSLYDGSPWYWTEGDYTGQADDLDIVKADTRPLTAGAWIRQRATKIVSRRGDGWKLRSGEARFNDSAPHLFDMLPRQHHDAILNGTSTYDATGDVIAAVARATAQGSPLQLPAGRIGVTGEGVKLGDRARLIGRGQQLTSIRKLDPAESYAVLVDACRDVEISGLTIDGARTAPGDFVNSNFCLYAHRATNLRLFDVAAIGALGDGMTFEYCRGVRGLFLTCNDSNKDGLYCSGSDDVTFTNIVALRNRLINVAMAATWDWSVSNVVCAAGGQAEFGISRDSRHFRLSDATLGDRYNGMAPVSLYVLGEPVGNQTLHLDANGQGGITYTTSYFAGAERGVFSNVKCRGRVDLELLVASTFDDACSMEDSPGAALNMFGCSGNRLKGIVLRDYASGTGIGLLDSPKNGGVSNSDNTIEGASWYKTGAPDSYSRISDFAGKGGLREIDSSFNGRDAMFGMQLVEIPAIDPGAIVEVADIFVPLIRSGDAIERSSFERDAAEKDTMGLLLSYRVVGTNTVKLLARNYSGARTQAMTGTARVWYARK